MTSWRHSIALRYLAVSILAALLPLMIVGVLYDRYSSGLVQTLTGERLERRLTAIGSRLSAFLDTRFYQLETLAEYPAIISLVTAPYLAEPDLEALVHFEADQPDLYGILFFAPDGRMTRAVAGQAAAGPPYWGGEGYSLVGRTRIRTVNGEMIGPIAPALGRPGALLLVRDLRGGGRTPSLAGKIALHVRLASLTELMGPEDEAGIFRPVLLTPDDSAYSNVGLPGPVPANLIAGAEILPGWRPALAVEWDRLNAPLRSVRLALLAGVAVAVILLVALFVRLSRRIGQRIGGVVDGAQAIASGDLAWRIGAAGGDEIAILARAFNAMARRLQQVVRSSVEVEKMAVLGQFATGVAHEVRNPLAAMKTSVQALLGDERDAERRGILAGMGEEVDRLEATLDDLLNFARPREPKVADVPIEDLCRRITAMVEKQAQDQRVELICPTGSALVVRVDEGHFQQILMNLVLNALQAMPEGGRLSLTTLRRDGVGVLKLSDTGAGMTPDVLAKVTDPFFTTRPGGTGLGLAISRQLVEMNGGSLGFSSQPGEGTTVAVTLPISYGV